jgi:hypothetical protein
MASGHVNRTQRPNTWLHRPSLRREDSPCQLGAVHTWPIAGLDEPRVVDVEIGDRLVDADEPDLPADDRDLERPVRFAILFTKVFAISSSHGGLGSGHFATLPMSLRFHWPATTVTHPPPLLRQGWQFAIRDFCETRT